MAAQPLPARAPRAVIAPGMPLADAARSTLAAALSGMTYYQAAAVAGEIEPLHQMRVGARRLRAVVQLFAATIHGSRARIYKRDLPWLGHAAGAVRECDVIEALIRECGARLDPALADALTPLYGALRAQRVAAQASFVAELRTRRYARMCDRLDHPLLRRALPPINVGCAAPAMITPIARSARKAGKRIGRAAPPESFHRLRVRLKRMRYALEMLSEVGGKRTRKALMRLEQMQDLLGVHQDVVCAIAWLRAYAANANGVAPETLMAVGAMLQALITRRMKLAARACRRWNKIVRSGVLDDALEEISRAADLQLESVRKAAAQAARVVVLDAADHADAGVDGQALMQAAAPAPDPSAPVISGASAGASSPPDNPANTPASPPPTTTLNNG